MNNQQLLHAILRTDFKSFVRKVFTEVSAGDDYLDNWHIDVICHEILDMIEGKNSRLIVNVPPRYMKSIICSIALPAFLMGHDPTAKIICVSYNDQLAEKLANDCRNVMSAQWYQDLFPRTRIHKSRRSLSDFETTRGGGRMSMSIGGTLTGRGADWIVIDDPLKPADAMSDTQREKVNDWYGSTLCSRLNDKNTGKIMVIMQRLHENDLTGFLLNSNAGYKLVRLPVIAEEGERWEITDRLRREQKVFVRKKDELLHSARECGDIICEMRRAQGEFVFAGQYQQRPSPLSGGLVKTEWLCYYNDFPQKFTRIIQAWDTAEKTGVSNAYSACVTLGVTSANDNIYVLDVYRERLNFPDLMKKIQEKYVWADKTFEGAIVDLLIEDASSGTQVLQQLKGVSWRNGNFVTVPAESDKISRFGASSVFIENGRVLFPAVAGNWWKDFVAEITRFPSTQFKDQCDAFAHAVNYASKKSGTRGQARAIIF